MRRAADFELKSKMEDMFGCEGNTRINVTPCFSRLTVIKLSSPYSSEQLLRTQWATLRSEAISNCHLNSKAALDLGCWIGTTSMSVTNFEADKTPTSMESFAHCRN